MASMSPLPPHPYSGFVPQASSSTGSLRLPHDLASRSRSNTVASLSRGSSPVPISSAGPFNRGTLPGELYHPPEVPPRREAWQGVPSQQQHNHSYSSGAWVPPASLRIVDSPGKDYMSRSGSMDVNVMRTMPEDAHHRSTSREDHPRRVVNGHPDNIRSEQSHHAQTPEHRHQKSSASSGSSPAPIMGIAKHIIAESEHSKDGGDTLDLSRRRITAIEAEDVIMLRTAVGKDRLGVWRQVYSSGLDCQVLSLIRTLQYQTGPLL